VDPQLTAEALAMVDQANEAVKAAIAAASASQARMAALEASVQQLRAEAAAQQAQMQALRERASTVQASQVWTWPLLLLSVALLLVSAWLWLRLRTVERERQQAWLNAARAAPASPPAAPAAPSPSQVPVLMERRLRGDRAAAPGAGLAPVHIPPASELPETAPGDLDEPPEPAMQKTQPLVPPVTPLADQRDVSAEELIDLEQQAEFFVVLGQDEAAIDLLVAHLRDTGGASPLPYLKLLEIYHRLGDRDAYDHTRTRFNQRFNARAPAWEAFQDGGRTLEDYPQVMGWLQYVWPRPADAMVELEALLFRRDGGELFDLPAYREVLFLYSLARDLLDMESAGAAAPVDLLLPLGGEEASARSAIESLPTEPIDLDLSLTPDDEGRTRH
jgi:hypothetical protein